MYCSALVENMRLEGYEPFVDEIKTEFTFSLVASEKGVCIAYGLYRCRRERLLKNKINKYKLKSPDLSGDLLFL